MKDLALRSTATVSSEGQDNTNFMLWYGPGFANINTNDSDSLKESELCD